MRKNSSSKLPLPNRLTPEQFRAIAKAKGWTYVDIAKRWDCTREWVGVVARNPDRPVRYDDMLAGLPPKKHLQRRERDRIARADRLINDGRRAAPVAPGIAVTGEYRYHGYLSLGMVVSVTAHLGSVAEEGMRGVVFQVLDSGQGESYGVLFESGLWDWFSPAYVDQYLASTGLVDIDTASCPYSDEDALQNRFNDGKFTFWPELGLT